MSLQEKSLDIKTVGLLVFGESVLLQDDKSVEALVKQKAISEPQSIIDAYSDKGEWKYKKVVALALSKEIIRINPTKTSVLWVDTNEPILTLAVGQKPIDELGLFLSSSKNESTLQALSLKIENKYVAKTDLTSKANNTDSSLENLK